MTGWGTRNEIAFIRGLGSHRQVGHHAAFKPLPSATRSNARKLELLKGYQRSMELRSNWGDISKSDVADFVHDEIERIQKLIPTTTTTTHKEDKPHA